MTERTAVRARELGYDWHNVMHLVMGPVTEEHDELKSLAEAMDLPTGPLAGLNVQG